MVSVKISLNCDLVLTKSADDDRATNPVSTQEAFMQVIDFFYL